MGACYKFHNLVSAFVEKTQKCIINYLVILQLGYAKQIKATMCTQFTYTLYSRFNIMVVLCWLYIILKILRQDMK